MIKYMLICSLDHEFEAWFSNSTDYDTQEKSGLVSCPVCSDCSISKAIMAPNVMTGRRKDKLKAGHRKAVNMMNKAADKIRREIEDRCEYVGERFADEARAIHYDETDKRPIYGQTSAREAAELSEEGIEIAPLPDILVPKVKKNNKSEH